MYLADCDTGFLIFGDCKVIFADGFESGGTTRWSSSVPLTNMGGYGVTEL